MASDSEIFLDTIYAFRRRVVKKVVRMAGEGFSWGACGRWVGAVVRKTVLARYRLDECESGGYRDFSFMIQ